MYILPGSILQSAQMHFLHWLQLLKIPDKGHLYHPMYHCSLQPDNKNLHSWIRNFQYRNCYLQNMHLTHLLLHFSWNPDCLLKYLQQMLHKNLLRIQYILLMSVWICNHLPMHSLLTHQLLKLRYHQHQGCHNLQNWTTDNVSNHHLNYWSSLDIHKVVFLRRLPRYLQTDQLLLLLPVLLL